jgi:hypothetical protein
VVVDSDTVCVPEYAPGAKENTGLLAGLAAPDPANGLITYVAELTALFVNPEPPADA